MLGEKQICKSDFSPTYSSADVKTITLLLNTAKTMASNIQYGAFRRHLQMQHVTSTDTILCCFSILEKFSATRN